MRQRPIARHAILLGLFLALWLPAAALAAEAKVIAVLPFANLKDAAALAWLGASGDLLARHLRGVPGLVVVSPEELHRAARELEGNGGQALDVAAASKLGKMLGADRMLAGGFEPAGSQVRLVLRWLDPGTGQFATVAELAVPARDALRLPGQAAARVLADLGVPADPAAARWLQAPAAAATATLEQYRRGLAAYRRERAQDNETAIAAFQKAGAEAGFAPAQVALAQAYYEKVNQGWSREPKWLQQAVAAADRAAAGGAWQDAPLVLGHALTALGRLDQARQAFQRAAARNPDDPGPAVGLAEVAVRDGALDDAVELYRKALALRPRAAETRVALGQTLARLGRWQEASSEFTQAQALRPRWTLVYTSLGECQLRLKQPDAARKTYEQALALNNRNWSAHYGLGQAHSAAQRWPQAIAAYQKAVDLYPAFPYLHTSIGDAFFHLKQLDDAIEAYSAAAMLRPDDVAINYNLAALYAMQKKTQFAIHYLQRAMALDPGMADAARQDKDFDNIRSDDRFVKLVGVK